MLINFIKKTKKSFTLLEVLIVCGFFSIVILAIIGAITRAYDFMNNTRMQVRAVNFAREGVEMMFNIRDTNRRRHSGERDKYWNSVGGNGTGFKEGIYVLNEIKNSSGDMYLFASGLAVDNSKIDDFYGDGFWTQSEEAKGKAKITFTGAYNYLSGIYEDGNWEYKSVTGDIGTLLGNETEFYRIVRVYDVVDKLDGCGDGDACPKEMRFCVKVFYKNHNARRSTELCSIMTNFEE